MLTQSQTQQALAMTDDRNLTAHTYNESLAEEIYAKIPNYQMLMLDWLNRLEIKTNLSNDGSS